MENAPKTATHYLPAPNGNPQLWYRIGQIRVNTGEIVPTLEYQNHWGGWSGTNAANHIEQIEKLIKIETQS